MSDAENHHHGKNEIIIKRHAGGDHDGHHGGAWKIAYADFMTAMMAFFLVMWLVNAANEQTKASVASYFNPIKLADEKPTAKGVKKPVDQAEGEEQKERSKIKEQDETVGKAAATGEDMTSTSGDKPLYSEADLFENPYSVLAEIAQEVGQQANVSAKGEGGANDSGPSTGASGGEAYRDPFDPDFWSKQVKAPQSQQAKQQDNSEPVAGAEQQSPPPSPFEFKADGTVQRAETAEPPVPSEQQVAMAVPKPRPDTPASAKTQDNQSDAKVMDAKATDGRATDGKATDGKSEDASQQQATQKQADALKSEIEASISGVAGKLAEGLIVTPAEGGLLVTLTDQSNQPMFDIGSALPRREMVLTMEKIGKLLAERKGAVIIRGHTDGRPYRGADKDNWGLSMSRAHAAYYMLVRGGLDESRIKQVSGFADRRLLKPEDPLADANRRIEILIQGGEG
ncbi:MotB family protein [Rhizobium paknamense]|uniref:Chemotaxis protein MotB n=1 Tax=Rhizobium paknamense TaxID=1206817 RepID=A0ABU0IH97_9HYPH|nr:MotB family protein [Rhizobium paknamense]MDQ0456998.1 chemotaxis protein MotB [Rhizobium paknamense]